MIKKLVVIVVLCIILKASIASGITPPLLLADKTRIKDLAITMWIRSELRTNNVKIIDVGCGQGFFLPVLKEYFERNLGMIVDKIVGIDTGAENPEDGHFFIRRWNEKLKEKHEK